MVSLCSRVGRAGIVVLVAVCVSGLVQPLPAADATPARTVFLAGGLPVKAEVIQGWQKTDALARAGTGLMFLHYAVHPSRADGEKYFRPWIGGAFEDGFSVNPHWVAAAWASPVATTTATGRSTASARSYSTPTSTTRAPNPPVSSRSPPPRSTR